MDEPCTCPGPGHCPLAGGRLLTRPLWQMCQTSAFHRRAFRNPTPVGQTPPAPKGAPPARLVRRLVVLRAPCYHLGDPLPLPLQKDPNCGCLRKLRRCGHEDNPTGTCTASGKVDDYWSCDGVPKCEGWEARDEAP